MNASAMATDYSDREFIVHTSDGARSFKPSDGHVLPHEHFLLDMRSYWEHNPSGPYELETVTDGLTVSTLDEHRRRPQGTTQENLVLSDWYLAAIELNDARKYGCQLVVDVSPQTIGYAPELVVKAAKLASTPIVLGVGRYLESTLSPEELSISADLLAEEWLEYINSRPSGQQVGIIGEIGTSAKLGIAEMNSLRAAALAHRHSGLPINVHLEPAGYQGHKVLDVLEESGVVLNSVALSHCDGVIDLPYLKELASRGAYVEFDLFGTGPDWTIRGRGFASDRQRIDALTDLAGDGYGNNLLISHDICMKNSLRRHGGWGYAHIGRQIIPVLDSELGRETRELISSVNPLTFLHVPRAFELA